MEKQEQETMLIKHQAITINRENIQVTIRHETFFFLFYVLWDMTRAGDLGDPILESSMG